MLKIVFWVLATSGQSVLPSRTLMKNGLEVLTSRESNAPKVYRILVHIYLLPATRDNPVFTHP